MKKFIYILTFVMFCCGCSHEDGDVVVLGTKWGDITIELYEDTPLTSGNFKTLARTGQYDSLTFHRVIKGFMIQGGDPLSRYADEDTELGANDIGDPIEAEILYPQHFHKRGAVCMARLPDSVNPERRSSGSQFYIVTGQVCTDSMLDEIEAVNNRALKNAIFYEIQPFYEDSLRYYQEQGMYAELSDLQFRVMAKVQELWEQGEKFTFGDSIREVYKRVGGAPHLDGKYTVFGEVVDGWGVLDSIENVCVRVPSYRPTEPIRFSAK